VLLVQQAQLEVALKVIKDRRANLEMMAQMVMTETKDRKANQEQMEAMAIKDKKEK
jgi:hypothetical protein